MLPVILILLFVGGLIGFLSWAGNQGGQQLLKRASQLRSLAAQRTWTISDDPNQHPPDFYPFRRGMHRTFENTMIGEWRGRRFQAGDYRFENSHFLLTPGEKPAYPFFLISYLHVPLHDLAFPATILRCRRFPTPLTPLSESHVAADEAKIYLPEWPAEFRAAFHIYSTYPRFAQRLLTPELRQMLMHHSDYTVFLGFDGLLICRGNQRWPVEHFVAAADFACDLLEGISSPAWKLGRFLFEKNLTFDNQRLAMEPPPPSPTDPDYVSAPDGPRPSPVVAEASSEASTVSGPPAPPPRAVGEDEWGEIDRAW